MVDLFVRNHVQLQKRISGISMIGLVPMVDYSNINHF